MAPGSLTIAGAGRPHPEESVNGDAWQVDWHEALCRLSVVDGLGHGPHAAAAANAALAVLAAQPALEPAAAIQACHRALAGTRGAVLGIVTIDLSGGVLVYAGVGNIEARLTVDGQEHRLMSYRGIVGNTIPTVRTVTAALPENWLLVLHTDGISARADFDTVVADTTLDLQAKANAILGEWGRQTDDATVVMVRC